MGAASTHTKSQSPAPPWSLPELLGVAVWFGIVTGLIEGFGLLLFQRINWERWGPMTHMSEQILWISPIVDVLFFLLLALLVAVAARLVPRLPRLRGIVFLLTTLALYDWLTLTGRLHSRSRWLLSIGVAVALGRWLAKHEAEALRFWKRTLPWAVAAVVLMLAGIQGGRWIKERRAVANLPPAAPGAPNVLVIVVDTLRADHLSSYGYARPTSPNIDRLAREGVLFENAVSGSSWTFPSHVSLVTGLYQFQHGMGLVQPVPVFGPDASSLGGYPTIGEALERQGYRTGAFSANRAFFTANVGFNRGFIHFADYFYSLPDTFIRTLLGQEAARIYHKESVKRRLRAWGLGKWLDLGTRGFAAYGMPQTVTRKPAHVVNDELLRWVDDGPSQRPFFAFLNYFDVHDPYGGPSSYPKPDWNRGSLVDEYDAGIKHVDDFIGRLMQELERRGLAKNTLVVFTSDHGESLGEHRVQGHGRALYWGLVHVPLVIWYPGHVPAGVRIARPVSNVALPATIENLLAINSRAFAGPALSLLWQKPEVESSWPDPIAELAQNELSTRADEDADRRLPTGKTGPMKSLVTARWQLIMHKNLGDQVYDWIDDPGESHNLIQSAAGQEVARRLTRQMVDVFARESGGDQARHRLAAVPLQNGTFVSRKNGPAAAETAVNDYYRLTVVPGAVVMIEVKAQQMTPESPLDPLVAIEGTDGDLLQTCRNPADDHRQLPGLADSTPDAFDDLCVNDDAEPRVVTDSKLEVLVPGSGGTPVELFLRVADWNGRVGTGWNYQIALSGARRSEPETALGAMPGAK